MTGEPEPKRFTSSRPRSGPTLVQIGITERCNYACLFCMEHTPYRQLTRRLCEQESESSRLVLDREVFSRLVADLSSLGCEWLQIVGLGEPLMHKHALDMMREVRDAGLELGLTTNAALLREDTARELARLRLVKLHVSLDASSDSVYQHVHGTSQAGALQRVLRSTAAFGETSAQIGNQPQIVLSYVVFRDNVDDIEGIVELARAATATRVQFVRMGVFHQIKELGLNDEEWGGALEHMRAAARRLHEYGISTNVEVLQTSPSPDACTRLYSRIGCYMGHYFALIHADGRVEPCSVCPVTMGNLYQQSFREIWSGPRYAQLRRECLAFPAGRLRHLLATRGKRPLLGECDCFIRCPHGAENVDIHNQLYPREQVDLAQVFSGHGGEG
jgi:MoaA/NifB/PqqE/SkfB family radical SAM enzyme